MKRKLKQITLAEYNAIHPDYRGTWTTERNDLADWEQVREQYMGKRTHMTYDNGTVLLIEGLHFEIIN